MPVKLGNGGNGLEDYNPNDGKYVEDGVPNKSYDNPEEDEILKAIEKDFEKELLKLLGFDEELDKIEEQQDFDEEDYYNPEEDLIWLDEDEEDEFEIPSNYELKDGVLSYSNDAKKRLEQGGYFNIYEIVRVDLDKLIKDNSYLLNPENGTFSRRKEIWGERDNYSFDPKKDDNIHSPVQLTIDSNGNYHIVDGNHRVWAMYNSGIKKADFLVSKKSIKNYENEQAMKLFGFNVEDLFQNDIIKKVENLKTNQDTQNFRNSGKTLNWSNERLKEEIDYSKYFNENYYNSATMNISPQEFLALTAENDSYYFNFKKQTEAMGELDLNKAQDMFLTVDMQTGKVLGHEGRHRMILLAKNGYTNVQIRINARNQKQNGNYVYQMPKKLIGQDDIKTTINTVKMMPLSGKTSEILLNNGGNK